MGDLALFGGPPAVRGPLPRFNRIGQRERELVCEVLDSGELSGFMGSNHPEFYGGRFVRLLEERWAARFGCRHAVSVNSNTTGLMAALGAAGVGPGDEVIVPPMSMSATVVAPLFYGTIPVFVDLDPATACLDPRLVEAAVTGRTRVVLAVNLFGHPAHLADLRALCDRRGLILIEDNAQGPLASEHGRHAGTVGHIGVFSLNRHKHVQTGEGGVCCTDDDDLALRLKLIRNHGENLVEPMAITDIADLVGLNFRLSELSAAVGVAQLERIDEIVGERQGIAEAWTRGLDGLDGISAPLVREGCRHVYYVWAPQVNSAALGISRRTLARALNAEGVPVTEGYCRPLYRLPHFQRRQAIGAEGWPLTLTEREYREGMCPVAERLWQEELLALSPCQYDPTAEQQEQMIEAFHKVHRHRGALADWERRQG